MALVPVGVAMVLTVLVDAGGAVVPGLTVEAGSKSRATHASPACETLVSIAFGTCSFSLDHCVMVTKTAVAFWELVNGVSGRPC